MNIIAKAFALLEERSRAREREAQSEANFLDGQLAAHGVRVVELVYKDRLFSVVFKGDHPCGVYEYKPKWFFFSAAECLWSSAPLALHGEWSVDVFNIISRAKLCDALNIEPVYF